MICMILSVTVLQATVPKKKRERGWEGGEEQREKRGVYHRVIEVVIGAVGGW